jgi:hypothetical protein
MTKNSYFRVESMQLGTVIYSILGLLTSSTFLKLFLMLGDLLPKKGIIHTKSGSEGHIRAFEFNNGDYG